MQQNIYLDDDDDDPELPPLELLDDFFGLFVLLLKLIVFFPSLAVTSVTSGKLVDATVLPLLVTTVGSPYSSVPSTTPAESVSVAELPT